MFTKINKNGTQMMLTCGFLNQYAACDDPFLFVFVKTALIKPSLFADEETEA